MGDSGSFSDLKIREYVRKFGGGERFVKKILDSLDFSFSVINARTFDVEISNVTGFYSGVKCYELFNGRGERCQNCVVNQVIREKKNVVMISKNCGGVEREMHAYPILDSFGEVVSVIVYGSDVLERENVNFYDNLSDAFSLNEMIYDENGVAVNWKILNVNDKFCNIFGMKRKDLEGKFFSEIEPAAVLNLIKYFDSVVNDEFFERENYIECFGKCFEIFTFKFAKGQFAYIAREADKKKVVKGDVCDVEEKFYSILQNSQGVVYRYDFEKQKFDYISESIFTILGYPLGEFMGMSGKDFTNIIHPDDLNVAKFLGNESEREFIDVVEYRVKRKDDCYVWLRIKRVIFRDENGKLIYVMGDIIDISSEKLIEEDRAKLCEKIAKMRKRDSETKERITLTDKEKVVFWGLCRYPLLNDEELADKLGLKRSTLTAIRNRLKDGEWFSFIYVPNFHKLGCQFFSFFDGNLSKAGKMKKLDLSLIKNSYGVILNNYQDDKFFGIFVSDKYVHFKKFFDDFVDANKSVFRTGFRESSFFYDLDNIELRDVSDIINSLFGLKMKERSVLYGFEGCSKELNINEKRVLCAMIKDPWMSSSEVAKKVWISKPTVIKIKKKLLDDGYVYPFVLPDFKKLGFPFVAKFLFEFDSDVPPDFKKNENDSRIVLRSVGKKRVARFMLFSSEEEYLEEVDLIHDAYRKSGVYFDLDSEIFPMQKRATNNFNLKSLIDELLFKDEI